MILWQKKSKLHEKWGRANEWYKGKNTWGLKYKKMPVERLAQSQFSWNIRDEIDILFENNLTEKQNLSKKEKKKSTQYFEKKLKRKKLP